MRPKALPARDAGYAELVRRYRDDDGFADTVQRVASGLGLVVLAVGPQSGRSCWPRSRSRCSRSGWTSTRGAPRWQNRQADKVLHGLAHLAAAALAFPRPDDLGDDSYVGRVSVDQVDGAVREACRVLAGARRRARRAPTRCRTPRSWRRRGGPGCAGRRRRPRRTAGPARPPPAGSSGRRCGSSPTRASSSPSAPRASYRTTPRYQVQVRELAAQRAFDELLQLGVLPVATAGGALRAPSGLEAPDV